MQWNVAMVSTVRSFDTPPHTDSQVWLVNYVTDSVANLYSTAVRGCLRSFY